MCYFYTQNYPSKILVSSPFAEKGIDQKRKNLSFNLISTILHECGHFGWRICFGILVKKKKRTLRVCWFTYCYILTNPTAPEILNGKPYSREVDWWSLGVVMYTLLIGKVAAAEDFIFPSATIMSYLIKNAMIWICSFYLPILSHSERKKFIANSNKNTSLK